MERRPVALQAGGKDAAGDRRVGSKPAFMVMAATSGATMGSSPVNRIRASPITTPAKV